MDIDYSMLIKLYGASGENETRYSPAKCIGCIPKPVIWRDSSRAAHRGRSRID